MALFVTTHGEEFSATSVATELTSEVIEYLLKEVTDNSGETNLTIDGVYIYECERKLIRAVTTYSVI